MQEMDEGGGGGGEWMVGCLCEVGIKTGGHTDDWEKQIYQNDLPRFFNSMSIEIRTKREESWI